MCDAVMTHVWLNLFEAPLNGSFCPAAESTRSRKDAGTRFLRQAGGAATLQRYRFSLFYRRQRRTGCRVGYRVEIQMWEWWLSCWPIGYGSERNCVSSLAIDDLSFSGCLIPGAPQSQDKVNFHDNFLMIARDRFSIDVPSRAYRWWRNVKWRTMILPVTIFVTRLTGRVNSCLWESTRI